MPTLPSHMAWLGRASVADAGSRGARIPSSLSLAKREKGLGIVHVCRDRGWGMRWRHVSIVGLARLSARPALFVMAWRLGLAIHSFRCGGDTRFAAGAIEFAPLTAYCSRVVHGFTSRRLSLVSQHRSNDAHGSRARGGANLSIIS